MVFPWAWAVALCAADACGLGASGTCLQRPRVMASAWVWLGPGLWGQGAVAEGGSGAAHAQACTEQLMFRRMLTCYCMAVYLEQQVGRPCPPALRGIGPAGAGDFNLLQLGPGPPALPWPLHEPSHCLKPLQTAVAAMIPGSIGSCVVKWYIL